MEDSPYRPPAEGALLERLEGDAAPIGNPWWSIWLRPRATIRAIVSEDPTRSVHLLAILGGVANVLDRIPEPALDTLTPLALVGAALAGVPAGLLQLYLGGALLGLTGDWLSGEADVEEVRATIAWSNVPILPVLGLMPLLFYLVATGALTVGVVAVFGLLAVAFGVWGLVLQVVSLAEVQRFSVLRAIASLLLAGLLIAVPVMLVVLLFSLSS